MLKTCLSKLHSLCYFMIADYIYILYNICYRYIIYIHIHIYTYIYRYIYIYIYIRGFSHWGKWGESLPHLPKICSCPPHLEKFPHRRHAPPPSTTSSIFSCSHWSCSIFVLISYSLDT